MQDRIKRQPDQYTSEFNEHLETFKELLLNFRDNPVLNDPKIVEYIKFMTHVAKVKGDALDFLPAEFLNLLESHYNILNPEVRLLLVTSLRQLRTQDVVSPTLVIPVFFKLFRCKDKVLRETLTKAIIGDLKRVNHSQKMPKVNKQLQNFVFTMVKDPDEKAAKLSIQVMIELFKKRVWNDENTVNVISEGCMHRKSTLCVAACKFFLVQIFEVAAKEESDEESDDEDIHKIMEQAKAKGMKHSKKR